MQPFRFPVRSPTFLLLAVLPISVSLTLLGQSLAYGQNPARETQPSEPLIQNRIVADTMTEPIALPTGKALLPTHRKMIDEVMGMLPAACRAQVKTIVVRYDNPVQRGLGGRETMIVTGNVPDDEFRALLIHEALGHVMDLGCLQGTAVNGESEFRDGSDAVYKNDPSLSFYRISWQSPKTKREEARSEDFVSGYAYSSDVFEDLAESVTFALLHHDEFRHIAQSNAKLAAKLAWVEAYVLPHATSTVTSGYVWRARSIPWDTTRLPYRWIGEQVAVK